jgi:SAM-dependent methyltransferase
MVEDAGLAGHYGTPYRHFSDEAYAAVRRASIGEDIGQNSWMTLEELARIAEWLSLEATSRLLDVGCGAGAASLELARRTGCEVIGVDVDPGAIEAARGRARELGLDARASFVEADAGQQLPLEDASVDAIVCVDAITHLPDRARVLADWARVLRPGSRLVFTDPLTLTGFLGSDEMRVRMSIGYVSIVPAGEDERLLRDAGLDVLAADDTTAESAAVASRRAAARWEHEDALVRVEGADGFAARQRFFEITATLAREGRLSRFAYLAERPASASRKNSIPYRGAASA